MLHFSPYQFFKFLHQRLSERAGFAVADLLTVDLSHRQNAARGLCDEYLICVQ